LLHQRKTPPKGGTLNTGEIKMRKNMFRLLLFSSALSLCLMLNASVAFGQCGADGMQPCNPSSSKTKSKKSSTNKSSQIESKIKKTRTIDNTSKQSVLKSTKDSKNKKLEFIINYKDTLEIKETAFRIRKELLSQGFKQSTEYGITAISDPDSLYASDRVDGNSYLSLPISMPSEVREKIINIIKEILPDVHIETNRKYDNFLLWII
jgi:hypothetical protein